jgi:penicillin-binding protein 1A
MKLPLRILLGFLTASAALAVALAAVFVGGYYYVEPGLPPVAELRNVRLQVPLRIYSRDGRLIEQFGEQRRTPVPFSRIPPIMVQALLAAEDDQFFEHPGLDYAANARAFFNFVVTGGSMDIPGGSTITQQIARDDSFSLLSRDVTLVRKFREWIQEFTKEEILELYFNTTFFGQQSYGIAAAAQTYFDKELDELSLSDVAILVGIPQGPSIMNPYNSPERAASRRAYVLGRLRELNIITAAEQREALAVPIVSRRYGTQRQLDAPYLAEMVRAEMIRRFGPVAQTAGLRVTTTIDSRLQATANGALRTTLAGYDERHGYRGPTARVDLLAQQATDEAGIPDEARLRDVLADYGNELNLETGLVVAVDATSAEVFLARRGFESIGLPAVAWAGRYINDSLKGAAPSAVSDVLAPGDVVRFRTLADGSLRLAQLPDVQGAFVALDPQDGAIVSLVGGYDYFLSNYNRATQALRQPGSAFKPFVYSAAFEHGFTTATIINDAPIVEASAELEAAWRPENYTGRTHGEVRMREALNQSMNLAAIRTLREVGVGNTIRHLRRFGFDDRALPANATLALGSGVISPLNLAKGYAVFANGGHRVEPYFIERIEDASGDVLYPMRPAGPQVVCFPGRIAAPDAEESCRDIGAQANRSRSFALPSTPELISSVTELYPEIRNAPRVVAPQNVYLITDVMKDVIRTGSGARAGRELSRADLAGKTGTTNGPRDAWFAGFNGDLVATAWVGFDDDRSLGGNEQGGVTAIPTWISFMSEALAGRPQNAMARPPGIVEARINPENGKIASDANPNGRFELFRVGQLPEREADGLYRSNGQGPVQPGSAEPIF